MVISVRYSVSTYFCEFFINIMNGYLKIDRWTNHLTCIAGLGCKGAWTVVCTWQYRPSTGSIKPSLQHFQFRRVGLSSGIFIFSILSPHQRCLCRVEAVKSRPVQSIRDVIFPILKDRSARHYCCACGNLDFSIRLFSCWVVPVFLTWILLN
jgi:hypothetical protein